MQNFSHSILFLALILSSSKVLSQRFENFGLGYKVGLGQNADYLSSGSSNVILNTPIPSYSLLVYSAIRFKQDTSRHVFTHMKVGLGGSGRGGVFDVNGTATRITMSYIDLDILLPLNVSLSNNLNMQLAFGGTLGFKIRQESNTPDAEAFQPGGLFEMGISSNHGSLFGFSVSQSFTTYSILNLSLVFGITMADIRAASKTR